MVFQSSRLTSLLLTAWYSVVYRICIAVTKKMDRGVILLGHRQCDSVLPKNAVVLRVLATFSIRQSDLIIIHVWRHLFVRDDPGRCQGKEWIQRSYCPSQARQLNGHRVVVVLLSMLSPMSGQQEGRTYVES